MDVGATTSGSINVSNLSASLTASKSTATAVAADSSGNLAATTSTTEAFSLEISATGASISAGQSESATHGDAVKGLTQDQIDVLQDGINRAYEVMIKALTEQNVKMQGWLDSGIGTLKFDDVAIDAYKFGLPEVATTPEEAEKAVSEDGDYGVDAVADRIFEMADSIANGDVDKLDKMWSAIEEGFKLAKSFWKDTTGEDSMPEITQKTYDAIKQRIEDRKAEIGMTNATFAEIIGQATNAAQAANGSTQTDDGEDVADSTAGATTVGETATL